VAMERKIRALRAAGSSGFRANFTVGSLSAELARQMHVLPC
jgi:hypothetical protein